MGVAELQVELTNRGYTGLVRKFEALNRARRVEVHPAMIIELGECITEALGHQESDTPLIPHGHSNEDATATIVALGAASPATSPGPSATIVALGDRPMAQGSVA